MSFFRAATHVSGRLKCGIDCVCTRRRLGAASEVARLGSLQLHEPDVLTKRKGHVQVAPVPVEEKLRSNLILLDADLPENGGRLPDSISRTIDHHAMAVISGMMCEERAVHEELRGLCHEIVTAQSAEIELMQAWLQDWYGITYEPQMKPGDEKRMAKLAAMSGAEFEIEFMTMMIRHHEKAIREGLHCLDRAYHSELVELCENIIATQAEEIALMEQWLCEWYQVCQ